MFKVGDKIKCNRAKDGEMRTFRWWERHKEDIMTVTYIDAYVDDKNNRSMLVKENEFGWNDSWMVKVYEDLFEKGEFEL